MSELYSGLIKGPKWSEKALEQTYRIGCDQRRESLLVTLECTRWHDQDLGEKTELRRNLKRSLTDITISNGDHKSL